MPAWGGESVWLELPRQRTGRRVWIFLAGGGSAAKSPIISLGFVWISLDSLVRNETYQWVTSEKPVKFFLVASSFGGRSAGTDAAILACGK
jgi:hypothetical protein